MEGTYRKGRLITCAGRRLALAEDKYDSGALQIGRFCMLCRVRCYLKYADTEVLSGYK